MNAATPLGAWGCSVIFNLFLFIFIYFPLTGDNDFIYVGDKFDWTRWQNGTTTAGTGPSNDHTKGDGSGYYLHIDGSVSDENDEAHLTSPRFSPQALGGDCHLQFYYHAYGAHVDRLEVDARVGSDDTTPFTPVWVVRGEAAAGDEDQNKWQGKPDPLRGPDWQIAAPLT